MPQLIDDILHLILETAYNSEPIPDLKSFANYSLVSQQWSQIAQSLLFASVSLDTQKRCNAFLEAVKLSTERGRRLGGAVRILSLTLYSPAYVYANRIVQTRFPEIVSCCTKLYELRLTLEDVEPWLDETLDQLRIHSPSILALRIRDNMKTGEATKHLLYMWPTVRHLVLRSSTLGWTSFIDDDESPPLLSLFEFRWEGIHSPSVRFLLWLLNHSQSHLRILHLSTLPVEDRDGLLANHHGRFLHSLRLPKADRSLIQAAIGLREIYLLYDQDVTIPFLQSLPQTVQHIAFAILHGRVTAIKNIFQVKETGKGLQSLRAVSCYRQTSDPWPQSEALKGKGRQLGIDLVRHEHRGILIGNSEDLVFSVQFPRVVTIRQHNLMTRAVEEMVRNPVPRAASTEDRRGSPASSITRHHTSSQRIVLDKPEHSHLSPLAWDDENDRPLEPIVLDDPQVNSKTRVSNWFSSKRNSISLKFLNPNHTRNRSTGSRASFNTWRAPNIFVNGND